MTNADKNLIRRPYGKDGREIHLPVDGGSHIYEGTLVSQLNTTAMLVPGSTAGSGPAVGVAMHEVDNSGGADGARRCVVEFDRIYEFNNGSDGDACSEATPLFSVVYMIDDHTVADNDGGGTRQKAGRFMGMTEGGRVKVFVGMSNLGDALADASDVGIADAGQFTSQSDVESALQEIYQHLLTANASICFSLHDLREVDANGDVGDASANGGILASDTKPLLRAASTTESEEVVWEAANTDPVQLQTTLPADFDGSGDVTIDLWVSTDNSGGDSIDAATFTVETSWDGGSLVSDAATDTDPAEEVHKITATIAASDVPDDASFVTIKLIPGAHTNDPVILHGVRLNYKRKLLTA